MLRRLLILLVFSCVATLIQAQPVSKASGAKAAKAEKAATEEKAVKEEKAAAPVADTAANTPAAAQQEAAQPAVGAEQPAAETVAAEATAAEEPGESFVTPRETVQEEQAPAPAPKDLVVYQPKNRRDPTLSPDDFLLLQYREQQRLAALEAERQRKLAEERRKREEEERLRQLELARIKDPTREVRGRIKIGGIIGKEVFVGDKVYTIGNKIFGARIIDVTPDSVVFLYKGRKFVKKMQ